MTQVFDDTHAVPVTVIKAGPCVVAQVKTEERDGYDAVQLAFGDVRANQVTKPMKGHFDANSAEPRRHLVELRTDDAASLRAPARSCGPTSSRRATWSTWSGVSKGKGFAGVMKRHGFAGLKREPRHARVHRAPGCDRRLRHAQPRVQGHAHGGPARQRPRHRAEPEVVQADPERNLLLVKGAVPGPEGGLVMVRSAVKTPAAKGA